MYLVEHPKPGKQKPEPKHASVSSVPQSHTLGLGHEDEAGAAEAVLMRLCDRDARRKDVLGK